MSSFNSRLTGIGRLISTALVAGIVLAAVGLAALVGLALAGPNADGVLLVHYNASQTAPGNPAFIEGGLQDCQSAVTQAPVGHPLRLWHVYAAFPPNASPRVKVVTFGCEFNANVVGVNWTATRPGATQIFFPDHTSWPYTGSGVAVGFLTTLTQTVDEVYCFAGYGDQGSTFGVVPHPDPSIGGSFADDGSPARLDQIMGYGRLGFGVAGSDPDLLCPVAARAGACCRGADGTCVIVPIADCDPNAGDFYLGDGSSCPGPTCSTMVGACCTVTINGACSVMTFDACREAGGLFAGFGWPCYPYTCPPQLGACCEGQTCQVTVQEDCADGLWNYRSACLPGTCLYGACCAETGICYMMTMPDCLRVGAVWAGNPTCDPNPCDQPAACCFPETGVCVILSERECEWQGGVFRPNESWCDPNPCPQPPSGACCSRETGDCALLPRVNCLVLGSVWTYLGDGTECAPNPCQAEPGACCLVMVNGDCELLSRESCTTRGGLWGGLESECTPEMCPFDLGACCLLNQVCIVNLREECNRITGSIWTRLQPCTPELCVERGACCTVWIDGECAIVTDRQCQEHGGLFFPAVLSCDPDRNPCRSDSTFHLGACCIEVPPGLCLVKTEDQCNLMGGIWQANAPCSPGRCDPAVTGACCFAQPAGECHIVTPAECSDAGALYQGDGTTCDPNPCPQGLGACCIHSRNARGPCVITIEAECLPPNVWLGYRPCLPEICDDWGACCWQESCSMTERWLCDGTWLGWTDCQPDPCVPPTGACCLSTGECVVSDEAGCTAQNGRYAGNQVLCVPNPCEPTPVERMSWGRIKTTYR